MTRWFLFHSGNKVTWTLKYSRRPGLEILTCSLLDDFPGWGFAIGTEFQIHSWRLFIFVCLFPALAALVGLVFMPESPRFLLEVRSSVARLTTLRYVVLLSASTVKHKTHLSAVLIQDGSRITSKILRCMLSVVIFIMSVYSIEHQAVIGLKCWVISHHSNIPLLCKGSERLLRRHQDSTHPFQHIVSPLTTCGIVFVCYSRAAPTCWYHTFPHLIRGRPHGNAVAQLHLAAVCVGNEGATNPERFHRTLLKSLVVWTFMCVCVCVCFVQNARHDEAWMILRQVHDTNWKAKGEPERVFTVSLYCWQQCSFARSLTISCLIWQFINLFSKWKQVVTSEPQLSWIIPSMVPFMVDTI